MAEEGYDGTERVFTAGGRHYGIMSDVAAYVGDAIGFGPEGQAADSQLIAWTNGEAFTLISAVRDANGAITTASVQWPDGTPGIFTTDTASTAFPGAIDAYHVTYVGTPSKTITQAAVTRDANGAVTVQPALTIA